MPAQISSSDLECVRSASEQWPAEQVLQWAFDTFATNIEIASAFGPEGLVVIDLAAKIQGNFKLFILNTGYLFPETLQVAKDVERRYGIRVEHIFSEVTPEAQAQMYQPALWRQDPSLCCHLRKVKPLEQKLASLSAWITAIRREQTAVRSSARKVEWDNKFGLVKVNPLADWTHQMVWDYIRRHKLVYNPLHDRGYPSIGCTHCTQPIAEAEDPRSGRWRGFDKVECGLHELKREPHT
jgi:phosphoadenosine phosphosulfate reductase